MTIYTTPLQFGYFFRLIMFLMLLYRGILQRRLSDKMLAWVMFLLAMELQDYTFGFAGINVLWNELNGFPRGVTLLFGPVVYLYFRSQINRSFRITRRWWLHFIPYTVFFLYHIVFFVQGPEAVAWRQESQMQQVLYYIFLVVQWASYIYYLSACLGIYRRYRRWSLNQFSNEELIGFNWFRNFILAMLVWLVARQVMNILDMVLDLSFYQDWWWNLVLVVVAFYIGLTGYAQPQPSKINFEHASSETPEDQNSKGAATGNTTTPSDKNTLIAQRLNQVMTEDRLFLDQDLNLQDLAKRVKTNSVELSAVINQQFHQNFNDYINALRVEEFIRLSQDQQRQHLTFLSNAYDAGFSSKSTFNRAFKKLKGTSPGVYLKTLETEN